MAKKGISVGVPRGKSEMIQDCIGSSSTTLSKTLIGQTRARPCPIDEAYRIIPCVNKRYSVE